MVTYLIHILHDCCDDATSSTSIFYSLKQVHIAREIRNAGAISPLMYLSPAAGRWRRFERRQRQRPENNALHHRVGLNKKRVFRKSKPRLGSENSKTVVLSSTLFVHLWVVWTGHTLLRTPSATPLEEEVCGNSHWQTSFSIAFWQAVLQ